MRALVLNDEQPGDLPLDGRSDQHGSGLGCSLNARGNIGRFAEHLAGGVDDDGTAFEADADGKLRSVAVVAFRALKFAERLLDAEGGPDSAFGVILLRPRIAEDGHQPIAEPLELRGRRARSPPSRPRRDRR